MNLKIIKILNKSIFNSLQVIVPYVNHKLSEAHNDYYHGDETGEVKVAMSR